MKNIFHWCYFAKQNQRTKSENLKISNRFSNSILTLHNKLKIRILVRKYDQHISPSLIQSQKIFSGLSIFQYFRTQSLSIWSFLRHWKVCVDPIIKNILLLIQSPIFLIPKKSKSPPIRSLRLIKEKGKPSAFFSEQNSFHMKKWRQNSHVRMKNVFEFRQPKFTTAHVGMYFLASLGTASPPPSKVVKTFLQRARLVTPSFSFSKSKKINSSFAETTTA